MTAPVSSAAFETGSVETGGAGACSGVLEIVHTALSGDVILGSCSYIARPPTTTRSAPDLKAVALKLSSYLTMRVTNFSAQALCEVLEAANLDWRIALVNANLHVDAVMRLGGTLPARKELAFQLEFVELVGDRVDLLVRAAEAYTLASFGLRGLVLACAPTTAAFVDATTNNEHMHGLLEVRPLKTPDGKLTGIEYSYADTPTELLAFSVYRELTATSRILSMLYGNPFPFTRVECPLDYVVPSALASILCDVAFGSEAMRFWWDPATSERELPFGNAFQHATWLSKDNKIIESLRSSGDWRDSVKKAIRAAPATNRKLANVAAALRVSPRTLQRRLKLSGVDFADLRDATLNELAIKSLLSTDESVGQISHELGYGESGTFTMAFKRWNGVTPTAFRSASRPRKGTP